MDVNDNLSADAPGEGDPPVPASPEQEASAQPADASAPAEAASGESSEAEGSAEADAAAADEPESAAEASAAPKPADGSVAQLGGEEPSAPPPAPPESLAAPPRRRHHVAPALIAIERVLEDTTFRIRDEEGDLSLLATDIARLGQLHPVDLRLVPPDRFQVICGFRRVAALRFLQRDKVLARLHTDLSDEDSLLMALASAIHAAPVEREQLEAVKERLDEEGRLSAAARDMLEKALATESMLAPEGPEQEIDADELALDVTARLGAINQDLALLADVFSSLDDERKNELIQQLRYSAELVAFLEGR